MVGKVLKKLKSNIDEVINIGKTISTGKLNKEGLTKMKGVVNRLLDQAGNLKGKPKSRTAVLIDRINKHRNSLARFADNINISFHNNRAEQQIRPAVIFRKISFGNRTDRGAYRYSILSSLIQTLRLQNKDIAQFLKKIIETPEEQRHLLVKELNPG